MRKHTFEIGEYYHIYNRGVDKRDIILDDYDLKRFIKSLNEFNNIEPTRSLYHVAFNKYQLTRPTSKLVSVISNCINPNHFHLLITPLVKNGVEELMKRLGGYTKYFNEKNKRSGSLFQGRFKSKHIKDNRYLLHVSTYINMNNRDELTRPTSKLSQSSLDQYIDEKYVSQEFEIKCDTDIILSQFKNKDDYRKFCIESWKDTIKRKAELEF